MGTVRRKPVRAWPATASKRLRLVTSLTNRLHDIRPASSAPLVARFSAMYDEVSGPADDQKRAVFKNLNDRHKK